MAFCFLRNKRTKVKFESYHNSNLKRLSLLLLQYYRILLPYNLVFIMLWLGIAVFGFGELNVVVWFWAVVCGFWSAVALHYYSAKESYFYFRNAGYRMRRVIITAFVAE